MKDSTKAIHTGINNTNGGVVTPIDTSSTFRLSGLELDGCAYSRLSNPTVNALEEQLAALEDAPYALAFSSGMGAVSSTILGLLEAGDTLIASDDLYGGTQKFLNSIAAKLNINVVRVDATNAENVRKAITPSVKMIYLETPSNPLLKLTPIWDICNSRGTGLSKPVVVVDNTFATPAGQKPLALGADISLHSLTKYINGHSDVIAGAIMTHYEELRDKIFQARTYLGTSLSPFDASQVSRGAKTFHFRMAMHEDGAWNIALFLKKHTQVKDVVYPGLKSHPQHELAKKQMNNYGGIVTFKLKGGTEAVEKFLNALNIFTPAVSLGGVESLIEVPYFHTHGSMPAEEKEALGITKNMIRVAAGIEEPEDLISDLTQALYTSMIDK